ncbi:MULTISPECIES: SDR family NAD(P)-dependent oxidoreductase [Thermomonospora]|uniref:3-oxoacyl-[acyl-carrier protein] reductase n=1 Tax=Thermomonospora cellulosilytica TaxID=1411118 RepID=A0A7W3N0Z6_9ACTN|nr:MULTISPECIES: SDR family NAD(P)-dependent oxidoreductase [Thermomonospora]MBA9005510.1 3-oxoacyl-[acyl-carrier protein] reductase [Thermomonospora cellulosilytica]
MSVGTALDGRRVLVTGGTKGIGRATVRAFARAGARVVTCYHRDAKAADALTGELADEGVPVPLVVRADVTDQADVRRLAERCADALGGLDVLVNNAGVDGSGALEDLPPQDWERVLNVDVTAYYLVTQAVLPLLAPGASVINVGASSALRGRPGAAHHGAAKAAVIGLTASLAKELGPRDIRVNTVAPGLVEDPDDPHLPARMLDRVRAMTSLGRLAGPADVAGAVLFLAGENARCITGSTLNVDGGM